MTRLITPFVFPTIATSRQGIIDRSDIGTACLILNKARTSGIEFVYKIRFFTCEPSAALNCCVDSLNVRISSLF